MDKTLSKTVKDKFDQWYSIKLNIKIKSFYDSLFSKRERTVLICFAAMAGRRYFQPHCLAQARGICRLDCQVASAKLIIGVDLAVEHRHVNI